MNMQVQLQNSSCCFTEHWVCISSIIALHCKGTTAEGNSIACFPKQQFLPCQTVKRCIKASLWFWLNTQKTLLCVCEINLLSTGDTYMCLWDYMAAKNRCLYVSMEWIVLMSWHPVLVRWSKFGLITPKGSCTLAWWSFYFLISNLQLCACDEYWMMHQIIL